MKSTIQLRVAAKTDIGRKRTNNEDNCYTATNAVGTLLVVADGMGGMNAGEVASKIAVDTAAEYFVADRISDDMVASSASIEKFMKSVVTEADRRIKSSTDEASRGMGTTIVMAWIIGDKARVCWCGDSRAYAFNPVYGLRRVSKDHSYVQALVDSGAISAEQAFDYPDSNIITRCLCDAEDKAEPDYTEYPLHNSDIILLCSDGLCGMLRDSEMQSIMAAEPDDVAKCVDNLITAALDAGGKDNVTAVAARIEGGAAQAVPEVPASKTSATVTPLQPMTRSNKMPAWMWGVIAVVVIGIIAAVIAFSGKSKEQHNGHKHHDEQEVVDVRTDRSNHADSEQSPTKEASTAVGNGDPVRHDVEKPEPTSDRDKMENVVESAERTLLKQSRLDAEQSGSSDKTSDKRSNGKKTDKPD